MKFSLIRLCIFIAVFLSGFNSQAQCPPNIDFEFGDFTGWKCYSQDGYLGGTPSPTLTVPTPGRHDMLSIPPGNGLDPYGDFPQNCPNGSGHSIRIGHSTTGGQMVDKVSYTFTIPAGQNTFSLIYHYALVLNDGGNNHNALTQPKFYISTLNLTDGIPLPCQLPEINVATNLPGFFTGRPAPNGSVVKCKDWAANSLNLDGLAGKTIEISFMVTGCGLNTGTHFGYAYLDVNTECSSSFDGATFCPDDTAINVTGPYGYLGYRWFNIYNTTLGTGQTLHLSPPPLSGDSIFVELTPFAGYGCVDTLTAHLWDTLTVYANAGRDTTVCPSNPVQLGRPPQAGLTYSWSPATGLSDPNIANPIATATDSTRYILSIRHDGGGCLTMDTVNVNVVKLRDTLMLIGDSSYCTASGHTTVLKVFPADSIQWYKDGAPIPGATTTTLTVTQSGLYHATVFGFAGSGCNKLTRDIQINIYPSPVAGFTVNDSTQCFAGNLFDFKNASTIAAGTMQYSWDFGDGGTANMADATHSYVLPGTYIVKMVVSAAGACSDSSFHTMVVYPGPSAGFTIDTPKQCFNGNLFHFSNNSTIISGNLLYRWDMGNGDVFTTKDLAYSYPLPGVYTVNMRVTAATGGCYVDSSFDITVYPSPVAGFTVNIPTQCLPGNVFNFKNISTLAAGTMKYLWDLGDGTIDSTADITHTYALAGTYTVKLMCYATGNCNSVFYQTVVVNEVAYPDFKVDPVCTDIRVPIINRTKDVSGTTSNFMWDFGNGDVSSDRTPHYSYRSPGTYTITLSVSTSQCPASILHRKQDVVIDAPAPGITYPVKNAIMNFDEQLTARNIGNSALWMPATSLSSRTSYQPVFKGLNDQLYTIQLRTATGCVTVDTQFVKTRKNIKIYVPNIFSPANADGKNDYLKPFLMSFSKLNYFRIFDRWGKLLFEMRSEGQGWDGRIKGAFAEMQTVIWMIEAIDVDGVVHHEQGSTILMR